MKDEELIREEKKKNEREEQQKRRRRKLWRANQGKRKENRRELKKGETKRNIHYLKGKTMSGFRNNPWVLFQTSVPWSMCCCGLLFFFFKQVQIGPFWASLGSSASQWLVLLWKKTNLRPKYTIHRPNQLSLIGFGWSIRFFGLHCSPLVLIEVY